LTSIRGCEIRLKLISEFENEKSGGTRKPIENGLNYLPIRSYTRRPYIGAWVILAR
jgi:hypothetical protein